MKLRRTKTDGNVISIERPKSWIEAMSYGELLCERKFLREEIQRVKRAQNTCAKVDPRGMLVEMYDVDKILKDIIRSCEFVINLCQEEMIKRMALEKSNDVNLI